MDTIGYQVINSFARSTPWLHAALAAYALWGGLVALAVLLVLGWLWGRRQPGPAGKFSVALLTGISSIVVLLLNQQLISPMIGRGRPCHVIPGAEALLPCANDDSMPSDHAIIAGAFVAGLWILDRRFGIVAAVLALVLAFARVYAGMHYPSDVMAGLAVGAILALLIVVVLRRPVTAVAERLLDTPLRALVSPTRELRRGQSSSASGAREQ